MKEDKGVLITIIVLLAIFLPLTILGYIQNQRIENNSEKKLHHNGYMWFYDDSGNFLSKYKCKDENCDFASSYFDEEGYEIKYFKDGDPGINSVINKKYVFINDNEEIIFYDIISGKVITKYKNMKNYNAEINNNEYLLENFNGMWGTLRIYDDMMAVIPFEYEYLGLSKQFNDSSELMSSYYLVRKDGEWYLIDKSNKKVTNTYLEIFDYRAFPDNLVVVTTNKLDVYDNNGQIINTFDINNDYEDLEINIENNWLKVIIDGEEKYNVELTDNIW